MSKRVNDRKQRTKKARLREWS